MSDKQRRYRLKELRLTRVDRVTAGANQGAHVVLFKSEAEITAPPTVTVMDEPTQETVMSETQVTEEVKTEETSRPEPEAVSEAEVAKAKAEAEEVRKELAETRAEVAKMKQERLEAEFISKAAGFKALGSQDEIGKLMLAAHQSFDDAQYKTLERLLKGASAQVEKGALFATFARPEADGPEGWEAKLEALAKEKVQAGTERTIELAKVAVMRENADIRAEYQASR